MPNSNYFVLFFVEMVYNQKIFEIFLLEVIGEHNRLILIYKPNPKRYRAHAKKNINISYSALLSQWQILGTGNLPQDSAPVCINIDISPEMAAQSTQRNQAFCVTTSDWSPVTSA